MRIRTGYSFRSAVGMVDDVMRRIVECGYPVAPISDRASTFGWVKWRKAAKLAGLRPIYGVELAVTDSPNAKKPSFDYWTFFAKENIEAVNKLVELASNQFRYEICLTYEQAMAATGVMKIAGSRGKLELMPPQDDLYIALAPSSSKGFIKAAKDAGHKFVASSDNKFTNAGEGAVYETVCGMGASTQTYPQYILSDEEWAEAVKFLADDETIDKAIRNKADFCVDCNADLIDGVLLSPPKEKTLREMCMNGVAKLKVDFTPEYQARLDHELKTIEEKKFEDYFYIIADVVQWARERMIVGPARGSSCGSLVCYLLQITTIDPIPYGLIFERFIDINRDDLPDIDIDFSDKKRTLVFDYMAEKYGADHVARLGTVALYKSTSALNEAARALDIPKWVTQKTLDSVVDRAAGDARALDTLEDAFNGTPAGKELIAKHPELRIACKMEGHPRHHSQHAAGIVLTQEPVHKYVAIDSRTGGTHCDKKDAEELNLLKIDALGLIQLSVFEDALDLAGLPHTYLESVPLDDQKAFDILNNRKFSGIFQFNGQALQHLVSEIKVSELEDFISITALARPGPMQSGGSAQWVKNKTGRSDIQYPHEAFKPFLENTLGIVVYQEQVMKIAREIGNMSWGEVTGLRKTMGKTLGREAFEKYRAAFMKGGIEKGIEEEVLTKVWEDLVTFGAYAFNRSHSVAYGIISYWCCYLKAHFPLEFAAATLTNEHDPDKQIALLRELHYEGVGYVPVDINLSTDRWRVGEHEGMRKLIGPVQNVKGIGTKLMQQIVSCRSRNEPLPARAEKLLSNPVTPIDSLFPIKDMIAEVMPDPTARNIYSTPTMIDKLKSDGTWQDVFILGVAVVMKPRDENEEVRMIRRGGQKFAGAQTQYLELRIKDDTGTIYCRIAPKLFNELAKDVLEKGNAGKAIYAVKGTMPPEIRMITVKQIRYLGDMKNEVSE